MNKAIVRDLIQNYSFNEVQGRYRYGVVDQCDWEAYQFLWHRMAWRLSDLDNETSWLSMAFKKEGHTTAGYLRVLAKMNRIRAHWGIDPLNDFGYGAGS